MVRTYDTALVTGASSGIGTAVVRGFAAQGYRVHALARRRGRLDALARETGCHVQALDVTNTSQLYATLSGLDIDVLVNNAGVGLGFKESLVEVEASDLDKAIATNLTAATHLYRAVAPGMIERRRGHIVNIGSIAGLHPMQSAVYGAAKGGIYQLSRNLRMELRGTGIRVTEICPGRTRSEFAEQVFGTDSLRRDQPGPVSYSCNGILGGGRALSRRSSDQRPAGICYPRCNRVRDWSDVRGVDRSSHRPR